MILALSHDAIHRSMMRHIHPLKEDTHSTPVSMNAEQYMYLADRILNESLKPQQARAVINLVLLVKLRV